MWSGCLSIWSGCLSVCQDGPAPAASPSPSEWSTAAAVLRLATELVDAVQEGVAARGFPDVRPAHGFAFARIAAGDATTADVAAHLGVTKQSAAELVATLVERGYVTRGPDPRDARARLLALTARGPGLHPAPPRPRPPTRWPPGACDWAPTASPRCETALADLALPGPLRPSW